MALDRQAVGLLRLAGTSLVALALIVTASGCGSSKSGSSKPGGSIKPGVELAGGTQATGGKALFLTASTGKKLSVDGGLYAVELRGIDLKRPQHATYDRPDYLDRHRCDAKPCEWTVIPGPASTYEFRAFLIDLRNNKSVGQSRPVQVVWTAPPRPQALKLLVNGKSRPTTPLDGEDYSDIAAGKMQVEARWATDARDTGYYMTISIGDRVHARCSTGTSCPVPAKLRLRVHQEVSWTVKMLTTRGDKVVTGFKVCLTGRA
jgi:hypothetical protein